MDDSTQHHIETDSVDIHQKLEFEETTSLSNASSEPVHIPLVETAESTKDAESKASDTIHNDELETQPQETIQSSSVQESHSQALEDDEFGDFEESSVAITHASEPLFKDTKLEHDTSVVQDETDDDGFGDFDDFSNAPSSQPISIPTTTSVKAPFTHISPLDQFAAASQDLAAETRISDILKSNGFSSSSIDAELNYTLKLIQHAWGSDDLTSYTSLSTTISSLMVADIDNKSLKPNVCYQDQDWVKLWGLLTSDPTNPSTTMEPFRWRKSHIRKQFLEFFTQGPQHCATNLSTTESESAHTINNLLGSTNGLQSGDANQPSTSVDEGGTTGPMGSTSAISTTANSANLGTNMTSGFAHPPPGVYHQLDPREADLLEAKRLCDITEEEMRHHSTGEIRDLIKSLMDHHLKMQEQANHWLDSKEQLVMDAEMHNKMIASLVQYAQQQQVTPKGGATATATKKKSRFGLSLK
ncbi:hypothetical protein MT418_007025 [Batrachochytrium dendrobatidis]